MKYRPEIDGLRAIAIIPVVLFHAGFNDFRGGFVGVDVFFVISGYLITTIILSDMEQGRFSLVNFYERRARRILPALFLVMLVCLPFAWAWLLPPDMQDFSKSLLAVATFSSNILFWHESGYWGTANQLKPLLHTWSLAVEEQYYVLFPLFLMLMWRFRKRWILGVFLGVAVLSLLSAQWSAYNWPVLDFFLLPTRAWELAIGAGIAFYFLYRKRTVRNLLSRKVADETLGLLGLLMIAYAVFTFNGNLPFPSLYALIPTIGTGLVIFFASQQTLIGRLLGCKPLVGIGLISYSLYLWHQPIFAFARHRSFDPPDKAMFALLIALSFLLAYASWRWFERPFRNKRVVSQRTVFAFATTGSLSFVVLGLGGYMAQGFVHREAANGTPMQGIVEQLAKSQGLSEVCAAKFTLSPQCRTSDHPEIAVWGDSFAMNIVKGILASNPEARMIQFTKSVCGPFFDVAPIQPGYSMDWSRGCLRFTDHVRQWLEQNHSVKYAVLASPFDQYLSKHRKLLQRNGRIVPVSYALAVENFTRTLDTLRAIGITPIVISPIPKDGENIGRCLARAALFGASLNTCNFDRNAISGRSRLVYRFMQKIERNFKVIHLEDFTCGGSVCRTHIGSTFLYMDNQHLSLPGSIVLGKQMNLYDRITARPLPHTPLSRASNGRHPIKRLQATR